MAIDVKQYGAGSDKTSTESKEPPSAEAVADFHTNADTDVREESIHHTLGGNYGQASPGDHSHDGGTSVALAAGFTVHKLPDLTAQPAGPTLAQWQTWRGEVEAILDRLGANVV